jgi:hypothetical protein
MKDRFDLHRADWIGSAIHNDQVTTIKAIKQRGNERANIKINPAEKVGAQKKASSGPNSKSDA